MLIEPVAVNHKKELGQDSLSLLRKHARTGHKNCDGFIASPLHNAAEEKISENLEG